MAVAPVQQVDRRYHAVRIPWRTTFRLRWYARSDRRAGLPIGLSAATTPVLHELVAEYGEACERERTSFFADADQAAIRLGQIEAQVTTVRAALARQVAEAGRLAQPPAEGWLSRRYPGEEAFPDAVTRERRAITHHRSVAAARATQSDMQRRLDELLAEQAELQAWSRARADIARSHVVRARELTHRKAAIYRRALVRRHPQREDLVRLWDTELCAIPAWASVETPLPTAELSGASA